MTRMAVNSMAASQATPDFINSVATGRVKSFCQKSGWGFIQLFENGLQDFEVTKDVFFHRADVTKFGTCELRPGILVQCCVVSTGKGEKASDIQIVAEDGSDVALGSQSLSIVTCMTCIGTSEDSLSHSPYDSEITTVSSPKIPPLQPKGASFSLRTSENYVSWLCTGCRSHNASRSILRVAVICASCGLGHQVKNWICVCDHSNGYISRQCGWCGMPHSRGCQELFVVPGQQSVSTEQTEAARISRKAQHIKSRWQHKEGEWSHATLDTPAASIWCQDTTVHPMRSTHDERLHDLVEKCKEQLLWAFAKLTGDTTPHGLAITMDWLDYLAQEIVNPKRQLFCSSQTRGSFVPNPCADTDNSEVLQMYEAVGMLIALAVASKRPLPPHFPLWMAHTLLGYPTTLEDLKEYNPRLLKRARNPAATEEITQCGVTRVFEFPKYLEPNNQQAYRMWLKDLYLSKSIDAQLKRIRNGFFHVLMGDHVLQELTPMDCFKLLNEP
eukprot:GGOE01054111.1.p1 GENE.GGOE01054111.1~~GGOE01054111.1.p1  ORF type:complete len:499 (+),score=66.83 GGOE01054111.1:70-1566(+)